MEEKENCSPCISGPYLTIEVQQLLKSYNR